MHRLVLAKPDGRPLVLYARHPLPPDLAAPTPPGAPVAPNPQLRWHPLRAEWVAYAAHRQDRTFLPPPAWDPLAPTTDPAHPTELPDGPWEIAVFANRFPTLHPDAHDPPASIVPTAPGVGCCEVVVFTPEREGSLGALPLDRIELLLAVWADRQRELGGRAGIAYVMPFENRGVEVGATLAHPHGQIYAYPFVPPVPATELAQQRAHLARHGHGLLETLIHAELDAEARLLYAGPHVVAFVPAWARLPYETWIAPRRAAGDVAGLHDAERADLARALKTVLTRYDGLWAKPFPYVLVVHQAPTDGRPHPEAHLHVEIYPALRDAHRLKYLAGTELGAGTYAVDGLPEAHAAALRAVPVPRET